MKLKYPTWRTKLKTFWAFPLSSAPLEQSEAHKRQSGVSLLIALLTIVMMVGLVSDLIINSTVSLEMAKTSRDRVKSEYLAKSGLNLALFLVSIGWGVDLYRESAPPPMGKPLSDDRGSLWGSLNELPPVGGASVDMVMSGQKNGDDPFKLRSVFSEKIANQMRLFEDQFAVRITDEGSRVNVNDCVVGKCEETIARLTAMFSCPVEKAFLESKSLTAEQLAYRIKDFITSKEGDGSPESGLGDKNAPYQNEVPSYKVKSLPFDSIDELKLVAGWDDEIHTVFSPYLTVFPIPKDGNPSNTLINLNTVSPELLGCLVPSARSGSCAEKFTLKMNKLQKSKGPVVKKDPKETLKELACTGEGEGSDKKNPETWFDTKSSVLRIEVQADTGSQTRSLVAVIRRIKPQEKDYGRDKQKVKRAYEILYWKLI